MDRWSAVERYVAGLLLDDAPLADHTGLPAIQVAPPEGKLLYLLARSIGARRILEIGTLGGYSAIWLARALGPGGELITLEYEPKHAAVARRNIDRAGVGSIVEIMVGAALDTLPGLTGPFDFTFIDADKPNNAHYVDWAIRLSRPGSLIVVDNVVRDGAVADAASTDPNIIGTRVMLEQLRGDGRVSATAIQTVGSKGYDGFALLLVN